MTDENELPEVTIRRGGNKFSNWTSVTIRKSIEQMADEFDLELSLDRLNRSGYAAPVSTGVSQAELMGVARMFLRTDKKAELRQDDEVKIYVGSELVLTGYVDNIDLYYDADTATLRVGGLSKAGDLVDSSAIYGDSGRWKKAAATNIINDLCQPFGIEVISVGNTGELFDKFAIEPGETCYETISRVLRARQMLAISQPDGSLVIYKGVRRTSGAVVTLGDNVLSCSANQNRRGVHNRYIYRGQTSSSDDWHGEKANQLQAECEDPRVQRYRPLVVVTNKAASNEELARRAIWERNVRAGRGQRYRYTVPGWLNSKGRLWEVDSLVSVRDDHARVSGEMLVATVEFSFTDRLVTTLELVPPGTYDPFDEPVEKKTKIG